MPAAEKFFMVRTIMHHADCTLSLRAKDLTLTVVALLPTNKIRATRDATTAKVWRVEEKMKRTLHPRV